MESNTIFLFVIVCSTANAFLWQDIQHHYQQNNHHGSSNNGHHYSSDDTDEPCSHILNLIKEWQKAGQYDAIKEIYEYIITHEARHQGGDLEKDDRRANSKRYTYTGDKDEAFNNFNTHPDVNRLKTLINEKSSKCKHYLQREVEGMLHVTHQTATSPTTNQVFSTKRATVKTTRAPTTTTTTTTVAPSTTTSAPTTTTARSTTTTVAPSTTTSAPTTTTEKPSTSTKIIPKSTTMLPMTTAHVTTEQTTQAPLNLTTCDGMAFVTALAKGDIVLADRAGLCTDGTHSASEALILKSCTAKPPGLWKQGVRVLENCNRIPAYTPIATFVFGQYPLDTTSLSGIFIECTSDGFKMAAQLCGYGPEIYQIHKSGASLRQNADNYYVIDL